MAQLSSVVSASVAAVKVEMKTMGVEVNVFLLVASIKIYSSIAAALG